MNRLQRTIAILATASVVLWCAYLKTHQDNVKTKAELQGGVILNSK